MAFATFLFEVYGLALAALALVVFGANAPRMSDTGNIIIMFRVKWRHQVYFCAKPVLIKPSHNQSEIRRAGHTHKRCDGDRQTCEMGNEVVFSRAALSVSVVSGANCWRAKRPSVDSASQKAGPCPGSVRICLSLSHALICSSSKLAEIGLQRDHNYKLPTCFIYAHHADGLWRGFFVRGLKIGAVNLRMGTVNLKMGTVNLKMGTVNLKMGTVNLKMVTVNLKMCTVNLRMCTVNLKMGIE